MSMVMVGGGHMPVKTQELNMTLTQDCSIYDV